MEQIVISKKRFNDMIFHLDLYIRLLCGEYWEIGYALGIPLLADKESRDLLKTLRDLLDPSLKKYDIRTGHKRSDLNAPDKVKNLMDISEILRCQMIMEKDKNSRIYLLNIRNAWFVTDNDKHQIRKILKSFHYTGLIVQGYYCPIIVSSFQDKEVTLNYNKETIGSYLEEAALVYGYLKDLELVSLFTILYPDKLNDPIIIELIKKLRDKIQNMVPIKPDIS